MSGIRAFTIKFTVKNIKFSIQFINNCSKSLHLPHTLKVYSLKM